MHAAIFLERYRRSLELSEVKNAVKRPYFLAFLHGPEAPDTRLKLQTVNSAQVRVPRFLPRNHNAGSAVTGITAGQKHGTGPFI